jgi:hypothetical protein
MSTRQVITLWIIALALGLAVAGIKLAERPPLAETTARQRGQTLLPDFPATRVATIQIESASEQTTLTRTDGRWLVAERANYPAAFPKIAALLRSLAALEVTQAIPADPSAHSRFGLEATGQGPARGTTLTFRDAAGAELATVVLGKRLSGDEAADPLGMGTSAGRFVRNAADPSAVYAIAGTFPQLSPAPREWLEDIFFQVEKIRSIQVARPGLAGFNPWTLTRTEEAAKFTLADNPRAPLDAAAVTAMVNTLANPRFEDVAAPAELPHGLDSPSASNVLVETFEGLTYQLRFAPLTTEGAGDNAVAEYLLSVAISGKLPTARQPGSGESAEAAAQLDAAFAERLAHLQAKLNMNSTFFSGRTFLLTRWSVEPLLKTADELIQTPDQPATPATR